MGVVRTVDADLGTVYQGRPPLLRLARFTGMVEFAAFLGFVKQEFRSGIFVRVVGGIDAAGDVGSVVGPPELGSDGFTGAVVSAAVLPVVKQILGSVGSVSVRVRVAETVDAGLDAVLHRRPPVGESRAR